MVGELFSCWRVRFLFVRDGKEKLHLFFLCLVCFFMLLPAFTKDNKHIGFDFAYARARTKHAAK